MEVPTAWGNVDGGAWAPRNIARLEGLGTIGQKLVAAPNVLAWQAPGELTTPGVFVGLSAAILQRWDPRDLANTFTYSGCSYDYDEPYARTGFSGWVVHWSCEGSDTRWLTLAGTTDAGDELVLVQAKLVSGRDDDAYRRVLASLTVAPGGNRRLIAYRPSILWPPAPAFPAPAIRTLPTPPAAPGAPTAAAPPPGSKPAAAQSGASQTGAKPAPPATTPETRRTGAKPQPQQR